MNDLNRGFQGPLNRGRPGLPLGACHHLFNVIRGQRDTGWINTSIKTQTHQRKQRDCVQQMKRNLTEEIGECWREMSGEPRRSCFTYVSITFQLSVSFDNIFVDVCFCRLFNWEESKLHVQVHFSLLYMGVCVAPACGRSSLLPPQHDGTSSIIHSLHFLFKL